MCIDNVASRQKTEMSTLTAQSEMIFVSIVFFFLFFVSHGTYILHNLHKRTVYIGVFDSEVLPKHCSLERELQKGAGLSRAAVA